MKHVFAYSSSHYFRVADTVLTAFQVIVDTFPQKILLPPETQLIEIEWTHPRWLTEMQIFGVTRT